MAWFAEPLCILHILFCRIKALSSAQTQGWEQKLHLLKRVGSKNLWRLFKPTRGGTDGLLLFIICKIDPYLLFSFIKNLPGDTRGALLVN